MVDSIEVSDMVLEGAELKEEEGGFSKQTAGSNTNLKTRVSLEKNTYIH